MTQISLVGALGRTDRCVESNHPLRTVMYKKHRPDGNEKRPSESTA